MIYQLSLTFHKDREIYIPTKKKNDVCGCLLWLCTLQYYFEMCSWRNFQYSSIIHALFITISIKSPPFTTTHIIKNKKKFGQVRGGKCPLSTPPDSAPAYIRCSTSKSIHLTKLYHTHYSWIMKYWEQRQQGLCLYFTC